jgi:competence protein ComEC
MRGNPGKVCGDLMLYVSAGEVPLLRGDRIRFATRVAVPRRLGLPGEFDYPRYLAFHGIAATGHVAAQDEIVLIRGAAEDSLQRRIDLAARQLGDFIRRSVPAEEESSVLTALLIGDQKRIPANLAAAYTRAGVNHILSISVSMSASSATLSSWSPCCWPPGVRVLRCASTCAGRYCCFPFRPCCSTCY